MRIAVYLPNPVSVFQASPQQLATLRKLLHRHTVTTPSSEAELLSALPDTDAVVVWRFDAGWYSRSSRLKHVFTPAAGRENVTPDPEGRVRVHMGAFHGHIMAESLLAMILSMNRRLGAAGQAQRARVWDRARYETVQPLRGQTVLIVGYGHIGQHAARVLRAVGMVACGLKRDITTGTEDLDRVYGAGDLLEAVAAADHIVCILPSDTDTDHMLGRAAFHHTKSTACVYNLGRGNAIDADELVAALTDGRVAGAFLDVTPEEPLPRDSELWSTPNLYLTPHASAIRTDYLDLYFEELAAMIADWS
jgi:phosphoglycerate dehydrogenase-like enzyme